MKIFSCRQIPYLTSISAENCDTVATLLARRGPAGRGPGDPWPDAPGDREDREDREGR